MVHLLLLLLSLPKAKPGGQFMLRLGIRGQCPSLSRAIEHWTAASLLRHVVEARREAELYDSH
jgi:hypothetical protein